MLWDVPTGRVRDTRRGRPAPRSLAFSPDGRTLAFADRDGSILAWDVERGRVRPNFPATRQESDLALGDESPLGFAPDGKVLASQGDLDPLVKLWDVDSGRLLSTIEVEPSLGQVVSFSPDGRR